MPEPALIEGDGGRPPAIVRPLALGPIARGEDAAQRLHDRRGDRGRRGEGGDPNDASAAARGIGERRRDRARGEIAGIDADAVIDALRTDERRVGKAWVSTFRSRWTPEH